MTGTDDGHMLTGTDVEEQVEASLDRLTTEIGAAEMLAGPHLARLTSHLVSIPSVNGVHPESAIADAIGDLLEPLGLTVHRVGDAARPSLAAVMGRDPTDTGVGLVLNGHLDTVPVDDPDDWAHPPFDGTIAGGAVHGRGACDTKGGLAIQIALAHWMSRRDERPSRLVLHFAMGEERGEDGTLSLLDAGFTAPAGVVLEPTHLQIGIAQRGLATLRLLVHGRAGHASRRDLADNPLRHVPAIMAMLERLESESTARHDLLGEPTWTPTSIHAGVIPSMIPGSLEILVDRRMLPGETVEGIVATMRDAVRQAVPDAPATVEVVTEEGVYAPVEIPRDRPIVRHLSQGLDMFGQPAPIFGTPYASDVRHLVSAGIDAVTFGPGRFEDMHARDEHIDVAELERAAHSLAAACALHLADP
jgi:succinyl-diaminopimelate desuccinylase